MAGRPPPGFKTVAEAAKEQHVTAVVGIIVDFQPPKPSRGTDWVCTFEIEDGSSEDGTGPSNISIRIFCPERIMPKINGCGDIVLARRLNKSNWGFHTGRTSEIHVFHSSSMPNLHFKNAYAGGQTVLPHSSYKTTANPSVQEQLYILELHHSKHGLGTSRSVVDTVPTVQSRDLPPPHANQITSTRGAPRNKLSRIEDIVVDSFYDLVVEVVKFWPEMTKGSLYVTDYTENKFLYNYEPPGERSGQDDGREGDEYGYTSFGLQKRSQWGCPFGRLTLQVTAWEPHFSWANNNISEGDFVLLKNVKTKYTRANTLEGVLHGDQKYPDRVQISKLKGHDHERVRELRKRKAEYEERYSKPLTESVQKKNKKKKKKSKLEAERREAEFKAKVQESGQPLLNYHANKHVVCSHPTIPLTSLANIIESPHLASTTPRGDQLKLPFVNARYRTNLRVIDYYPPNLADFSHPLDDQKYNNVNNVDEDGDSSIFEPYASQSPKKWEWAFFLLVEDGISKPVTGPPARTKLLVAADSAEYLLKMDPVDLRKDKKALSLLTEKMFVLWGNLQELKDTGASLPIAHDAKVGASSTAFDCCIEEFGVPGGPTEDKKWHRMHRMFGTTVM